MNAKKLIPLIGILLIGIYMYLTRGSANTDELAPDFTTELIDGSEFSLSDLRGDYVLIDFWGSWCGPCIKDNPNLVKMYNDFSSKNFKDGAGFKVVTIALERDQKRWARVAERAGFSWKHQIVDISRVVLLSSLAQKFGVTDVPAKFLVGPDGKIIGTDMNWGEIRAALEKELG